MAKIKIENVVASTSIGDELDLWSVALALDGAEYEPEQFPGLIYRIKDPKTATLLFRSGKVVCTGGRSLSHVQQAIAKVAKQIESLKKKHVELLAYDEKLRHYADMRIQLDLDDGVKMNYGKFGDLLAEVKAVTGGAGDE